MENYIVGAISLIPKSKNLDRVLFVNMDKPLYFLIEIKNLAFPSNALAYKIIQTTKERYFQGEASPSENFEEALKETNDTLAKLTEEGQTEWLNNLGAVIALVYEDRINIASVGSAYCYLVREGNIVEVTSEQPVETRPLNTFSNILFGDLKDHDRLVIGNSDFFENLSLDYLKQVLARGTLKEAISYISRSLKKEKVKTACALVLEVKKEPVLVSPIPETIYIDQRQPKQVFKKMAKFISSKVISSPALKKFFDKILALFKKNKNLAFCKNLFSRFARNKKWILIGFSCILFLILAAGIFNLAQKQFKEKSQKTQTQILMEAEDKAREANNALAKGDKEQAIKLFQEALNLLSKTKTKEGKELFSKIISQLDKLINVLRPKSSEILDFQSNFKDASVSQIFVIDKTVWAVDLKTNRIYQGKESSTGLPQYSGKFVSGTYQSPENLLIFYQDQEGIYEYTIEENKIERAKIIFEEKWEKAKILGSYFTNIYLLDPNTEQIYKHEKTTAGYSKGVAYLTSKGNLDLKKAISMAIDGYIYILENDGKVSKIMAGRILDFKISGIPEPDSQIKNPVKIFTASGINYLYILDGSRVLELDKSGNYQRMFVFELSDLKDLWVNSKIKKIYLLSGSKVYEAGM